LTISTRQLNESDLVDYENLVSTSSAASIHHSLKYKQFLERTFPNCQPQYSGAYVESRLVAAMPGFILEAPGGGVFNSLPFFGSHGGIITKDIGNNESVGSALISYLNSKLESLDVIAGTVIDPLFSGNSTCYSKSGWSVSDERIGQYIQLPGATNSTITADEFLSDFNSKKQWHIKKAKKANFSVTHDNSERSWDALKSLHELGMSRIGGTKKPRLMYSAIQEVFSYDQDYRLYTAQKDGVIVSALLVLFFNGTVEYFLPATAQEFLPQQPMSLLIFQAMYDALSERRARLWNFGGTWKSQGGVYEFKKRWGAEESLYSYRTRIFNGPFLSSKSNGDLLNLFPGFFVRPFHNNN
jgi:hypothetical protein